MILKKRKYFPEGKCISKMRYFFDVNGSDLGAAQRQKNLSEEKVTLDEEFVLTADCTMESLLKELLTLKRQLRQELERPSKRRKKKKIISNWVDEEVETQEDYGDMELEDLITRMDQQNLQNQI